MRVLTYLRDQPNCQFKMLIDICGVDHPEREQRFDVVYHLLSLKHNQRIRVKVATDEATPVPSVTGVFGSANWYERRSGTCTACTSPTTDLRRLLTDYGFEGHPMRKISPDRLRRAALRRRAEAGGLRAGQAAPGLAQLGFPQPREGIGCCRRREGRGHRGAGRERAS